MTISAVAGLLYVIHLKTLALVLEECSSLHRLKWLTKAKGGSRCAVVSTARYNPDFLRSVLESQDLRHKWPLSHCKNYVDSAADKIEDEAPAMKIKVKKGGTRKQAKETTLIQLKNHDLEEKDEVLMPMNAFGKAFAVMQGEVNSSNDEGEWLFSICKTASHEIGECRHGRPPQFELAHVSICRSLLWPRPLRILCVHNAGHSFHGGRSPSTSGPLSD